ncbi:MAG: adenylate/guanylate cyclase domain-containing protein [Spirochaetia bacterium]|nr:adenylate/guanylate cyclase domain-containing protein [Spirochaetia bacterium]
MTEKSSSKPLTRTEELFLQREYSGLRISFVLKVFFFLTMLAGSFSAEATHFERLYGSITSFGVIAVLLLFLLLIRKKKHLTAIGSASAFLDSVFLTAIVVIWYLAVGGTAVSPAFLLKSTIYTFSVALMILNSFALRPLYPMIVGISFSISQLIFFAFAISIESDMDTQTFNEHLLGDRVSFFLYFAEHIGIPLFFGAGALTFLTHIARETVKKAVNLEKDKAQMQRYFSPGIADKITAEDENFLKPGGTRSLIAVMFCDLRGFTKLSETLTPEEVVELLSSYHSRMVEVIFRHNGTLDKYIGDAIMATFGTPNPTRDDAENAIRAALDMRKALEDFNTEQRLRNRMELAQGIAINFGEAIVGNIGTRERLEYTVIGDTVNIASRMESLCKEFEADIVVSGSLRERTVGPYNFESLGDISLRGRDKAVHVFKVLS